VRRTHRIPALLPDCESVPLTASSIPSLLKRSSGDTPPKMRDLLFYRSTSGWVLRGLMTRWTWWAVGPSAGHSNVIDANTSRKKTDMSDQQNSESCKTITRLRWVVVILIILLLLVVGLSGSPAYVFLDTSKLILRLCGAHPCQL
jgi:hypothetical protein